MKIKTKTMKCNGWYKVIENKYYQEPTSINNISGMISLTIFTKVRETLEVNLENKTINLLGENYKYIQLGLENQNFWLTAIYDENDSLVEVYFDITLENHIEEDSYFYDLFTDIVLDNEKNVFIIDQDELKEALDEGVITKEQFELANKVTEELYNYIKNNKKEIINYCNEKLIDLKYKMKEKEN